MRFTLIIEFLGPKFGAILEVEVPRLDTGSTIFRHFAILLACCVFGCAPYRNYGVCFTAVRQALYNAQLNAE
jgi:hypothetical protein